MAFGRQVGEIGVRKSQGDVQVLRVGYINGKTHNAQDMKPPSGALQGNQAAITQAFKCRNQPLANGKAAYLWVVLCATALQKAVGGIHCKEGRHKQNFKNQNQIGIRTRPLGHFSLPEAL